MGKYNVKIIQGIHSYYDNYHFIDCSNRLNDKTSDKITPIMDYSIDDNYDNNQFIEDLKKVFIEKNINYCNTLYAYVLDKDKVVHAYIVYRVPEYSFKNKTTNITWNIEEYDEENFNLRANNLEELRITQIDSHDREIKDNKALRLHFCLGYAAALLIPLLTLPTVRKFISLYSGELQMEASEAHMTKLEFGAVASISTFLSILSTCGVIIASKSISLHKEEKEKLKSLKLIKE